MDSLIECVWSTVQVCNPSQLHNQKKVKIDSDPVGYSSS